MPGLPTRDKARISRPYNASILSVHGDATSSPAAKDRKMYLHNLGLRGLIYLCVCLWTWGLSLSAAAQAEPHYQVQVHFDPERHLLQGHWQVELHTRPDQKQLRLWLYADRLALAPHELNEQTARWIYPGEIDRGGIAVRNVKINGKAVVASRVHHPAGHPRGRDVAGSDVLLPLSAEQQGQRIRISLNFRLRIPQRFGRIGHVGDHHSLAAPWYPLVINSKHLAWEQAQHSITLTLPDPFRALLANSMIRHHGKVHARGPYAPLSIDDSWYARQRKLSDRQLRVHQSSPPYDPPPEDAQGIDRLHDLVSVDKIGLIAETSNEVLETLRTILKPEHYARLPQQVEVQVLPSRTELVSIAPGTLLVSDRLYQIFPLTMVREFHQRALRRGLFRYFMSHLQLPEAANAQGWAQDLRAVALSDIDAARRQRPGQSPRDLVGWAAFHPAVDQLLYAPQVPFVDVFFGSVDEPDPFRDDPVFARRPLSRGRRILESARDQLSKKQFAAFTRALLELEQDIPQILSTLNPKAAQRLPVWLAATGLALNYKLGRYESHQQPDGSYKHRVEIIRQGASRPEPLKVRIEDDAGVVQEKTWDATDKRGWVYFQSNAKLDEVYLDPEQRLPQSSAIAEGHPRGDDATSLPWRPPLLQGFNLSVSFSESLVQGFVDFAMRRKYDLDHTIAARVSHNARSTGTFLRYRHGFGRKRDNNQRIAFVIGGLELLRLRQFTDEGMGGWRISAVGRAGWNTQRYFIDPRGGSSLTTSARIGAVRQDDGDVEITASTGIRANLNLPIGLRQALVGVAGIGWTFGQALPAERQGLGGRFLLRGFESNEIVGDGRLFAVLEYRWTALNDLAINLFHLAWLREIQLALFTGAGMVFESVEDSTVEGAADIGAGVRFHFDYGGVQPGVLALDLAFPLTRRSNAVRNSDGDIIGRRAPFGFYLAFEQFM